MAKYIDQIFPRLMVGAFNYLVELIIEVKHARIDSQRII